ncbi:MAG: T9SS type A sorting domain-containing protein [Cyclobacteriaceae bacterium]|nr:T9SS type A sorting domain-containing protein [Cyclobacteriaceae bacterium]
MRLSALFVFICTTISAWGQLELVPILKEPARQKKANARTEDVTPLSLPFWDDFATNRNGVADPALWQYGNSVWINSGLGINPPSLNVATFDGLDSLGRPYSVNDVLAKGFADKMISAPIRMDEVETANRTNVAITFYYQYKGRGEAPDAGDILSLHFKNSAGQWAQVWSIENDGTLAVDEFKRVTIPITDNAYFHDAFQFRFQNFARLSGPYDTWHLDYIYINNGKSQIAPVFPLFPDRTVSQPLTSIFQSYRAVPIKHFFHDPAGILAQPAVTLTTLRTDQVAPSGQPVSYSSTVKITTYKDELPPNVVDVALDNDADVISPISYNTYTAVNLETLPDPSALDASADSIFFRLKFILDSGDDIAKPIPEADYDTDVFNPVKFRSNDSTSATFALSNYYAYDDGEAEYGAGLNKAGAQVAYRFDMLTGQPDTIVAVDIYFPRFGDESSQNIQLQVLKNLSDNISDILYAGTVPIQRNSFNKFWRVKLPEPITVNGFFHIGWRQLTSAIIAVGLDKNTVVNDKIFVNLNGTWEPDNLAGSLMIRPVFGKGNGNGGDPVTGVPENKTLHIYPNPSTGVFYARANLQQIQLLDITGKPVAIEAESSFDETRIALVTPAAGIYVLRARQGNQLLTQKIIVR